ncbi:hypothetical protein JW905_08715 [bacterium]|nr:hypothetical protein [candidate division CSSED10-310 bacterium]
MTRGMLVVGCILCLLAANAMAGEPHDDSYFLRIIPDDFRAALRDLNGRGYDIAGVNHEQGTIDVIVRADEYQRLASQYELEVLATPEQMRSQRVDAQYKEPSEIAAILAQYHTDYPAITQLISIGQSEQGRDIWAIKISDNPTWDEDEPVVLFNGQHHAREVMSSEVALDTIDFLLTRYSSNPTVYNWVNNLEIWVVPQVNVDGVYYVFHTYDYWRKDRHSPPPGSSSYGIDPNRNYPAFWGSCNGSSGNPGDDTYRGQFSGESYCVTRMIDFAATIKPVFDISYHSYSELVIYPYGCSGDITPEHEAVSSVGQTMAGLIQRDSGGMGYSPGTSWELLYATDGGDIDWYYAELGTFAYVIELNSDSQGFQPGYNQWRDSTVQRLRPAWQYLLNRIDGPGITGHVLDACAGTPLDAEVSIQEYPLTADESPRMTDAFGRYFRVVVPGEYHLEVTAPGYADAVIPVTVGLTRVNLDLDLVPDGAYGLYLAEFTILDAAGDNDGVLDPGETVNIETVLRSVGLTTNVSAVLTSDDPYVSISTDTAYYGTIPDGMMGTSQSPHFVVTVNPSCPEQHVVEFTMTLAADQGLCIDEAAFASTVSTYVYQCPILEEDLSVNPGFTIDNTGTGGWAYGHPTTGPSNGHTGTNCYATNLTGDYGNSGTFKLTSTPFDCSQITGVELYYWRWLRNESGYDSAYVEVSNDNVNWTIVWSGYAWDSTWAEQSFDISAVADGQPQVWVRWRLNSDSYVTELGFYMDDITICGETAPINPPTPAPTWTPTPDRTPTPTVTPVPPTVTPVPPTELPYTPTIPPNPTEPPATPTTPAPTTTPEPTATPMEGGFHADLMLNSNLFRAGEQFLLELDIDNENEETLVLEQYVILDVYGAYFFHPSWSVSLDFMARMISPGYSAREPILDFTWPEGAGAAQGLMFWLGFLRPGTIDVVGEIDFVTFDYE